MRDLAKVKDRFGGIDKNILSTVEALNIFGIPTAGSCEGHVDRASPAPYVLIEFKKYGAKEKKQMTLLRQMVAAFNAKRQGEGVALWRKVSPGIYFIVAGSSALRKWNKKFNQRLQSRAKGTLSIPLWYMTRAEIAERKRTIPMYQRTMRNFSKFLNQHKKY